MCNKQLKAADFNQAQLKAEGMRGLSQIVGAAVDLGSVDPAALGALIGALTEPLQAELHALAERTACADKDCQGRLNTA